MLNIIYRLYEAEADGNLRPHRPSWFSKQKCLQSFLNSVNLCKDHIDKLIFVHDGKDGPLLDMLKGYDVVRIYANSNLKSLYKTFDIADQIGGSIYFVEDDYLHMPYSIGKIDLVLPELKLVNGYDHSDRYTRTDDIDYELKLVLRHHHHWRTAESTCCTYAIESDLYDRIAPIIRDYALDDRGLFRKLHEIGVPLWTALPGLTTQVDTNLSPAVDWEKFNGMI